LIQIASGVDDARTQNRKIGPWVQRTNERADGFSTVDAAPVFLVEFDMAVSVSSKHEGGGGASISVAHVFKAGGGAEASKEHSEVSRIRFSVPICFRSTLEGAKDEAAVNAA